MTTITRTKCWNCTQLATSVMTREGSESLPACDNCTRIDRAEAERLGWTIAPSAAPALDAVKKCGPKTIPLYDCGGVAYVYCLKSAGHDGQHAP